MHVWSAEIHGCPRLSVEYSTPIISTLQVPLISCHNKKKKISSLEESQCLTKLTVEV